MNKHYKYKLIEKPKGYYINTTFSYRETALLALVIWKYRGLTKDNSENLIAIEKHINDLLDEIDNN